MKMNGEMKKIIARFKTYIRSDRERGLWGGKE
jgi:hypothetical protein